MAPLAASMRQACDAPRRRLVMLTRGDGSDRGQRLAAKAEGGHVLEVVQRGDLAGGMARQRQRQFVARDAAAVVGDADLPHAAFGQLHGDRARAGVEAVLQQFLDHRGRSLDHLAGGDLADEEVGKRLDGGHGGRGTGSAAIIAARR